ncbi:MAG: Rnase Y domain-containing protein, partial [Patescibacteria group bacterium]
MENIITFLGVLGGGLIGLLAGWFWFSKGKKISSRLQSEINEKERSIDKLETRLAEVKSQIRTAEAEAKVAAKEILSEARLQVSEMEAHVKKEQGRIEEKEKALDQKAKEAEQKSAKLAKDLEEVHSLKEELSASSQKHREALQSVAKLTEEQAKQQLLEELEKDFADFYAKQLKLKKQEMENEVEEKAKNLLAEAMQRYASEVAAESTATVVQLPSDDIKGKIIGKEGRNITAFEAATGVDVIIDDTPGAIILSGFDLVRRYVAKLAMEKLIQDGRIQPARIEEVVGKMKEQVGKMMLEFGKRATEELGITGYPQDLLKIIGRLRFRTSYGQNVLKHSVEMAQLGKMLAEEIGADPMIV